MAFQKPSVKKVKTTIESAQIYIRSERKWGKTTLFRNIVLARYGDPSKGMLLGLGHEEGYSFLDQLNSTQITNAQDLYEAIDWLIKEKGKEHNIEMVAFDVVDELVPIMEDYTLKLSIKETGKACKTINEAFGGFHKGQKRCAEEIKKIMTRLKNAGIGVFAISHTKNKTIKPQGAASEEEGYMTLTSTLESTYESVFADIFDIIVTGVVEKDINDKVLKASNRYLYFRGDGYVEAGGRLAKGSIVDKMLFEGKADFELAKDFINIVEEAMKKSVLIPMSDDEFKQTQKEETKEREIKAQKVAEEEAENEIDEEKNKEYLKVIKSNYSKANDNTKDQIKELMAKNNIVKFTTIDTNPTKIMKQIVDLLS